MAALLPDYAEPAEELLGSVVDDLNDAGIVWIVLGALWNGEAVNAGQMAEKMIIRGYEVEDYEIAIQAAMELGWVAPGNRPDKFCLTEAGKQLREHAEQNTNRYFYAPLSVLTGAEIKELHGLLIRLQSALKAHARSG